MGLLEKAGQMKDEGAPKAKKAKKAAAAAKPKRERKRREAKPAKPAKEPREKKARAARVARTMPEEFELAGRAARSARNLVDFIATYGALVPVLVSFSMIDGDFTYMWLGALAILLLNIVILPIKTNRTVGMFLTRTRFVNSKGNHPNFTHQLFSNLTFLFLLVALIFFAVGFGADGGINWKFAGVGFVFLAPLLSNYVVTKLRHANGQSQNMYDAMYGCWFVIAQRDESDSRWMGRLEALGDWGEKKGWSGADEEEEEAASD
jgi:uncharacterized membrane protein